MLQHMKEWFAENMPLVAKILGEFTIKGYGSLSGPILNDIALINCASCYRNPLTFVGGALNFENI